MLMSQILILDPYYRKSFLGLILIYLFLRPTWALKSFILTLFVFLSWMQGFLPLHRARLPRPGALTNNNITHPLTMGCLPRQTNNNKRGVRVQEVIDERGCLVRLRPQLQSRWFRACKCILIFTFVTFRSCLACLQAPRRFSRESARRGGVGKQNVILRPLEPKWQRVVEGSHMNTKL